MKKQYLAPQVEMNEVVSLSQLCVGSSPAPADKYIPVVSGGGNITAD